MSERVTVTVDQPWPRTKATDAKARRLAVKKVDPSRRAQTHIVTVDYLALDLESERGTLRYTVIVWTPTPTALTPYDTGERLEPKPWSLDEREDYGKVDFDDDCSETVVTLHVESASSGHVLKLDNVVGALEIQGPDGALLLRMYDDGTIGRW